MRLDVKKILFVGLKDSKDSFFSAAQKLGKIHFVDISNSKTGEVPKDISDFTQALKVLRKLEPENQQTADFCESDQYVKTIISLNNQLEKIEEALRINRLEQARIKPFGHFDFNELKKIEKETKRVAQFFSAKRGLSVAEEGLFFVKNEDNLDYFFSLHSTHRSIDNLIEMKIEKPINVLLAEASDLEENKHARHVELKSFAKYSSFLHDAFYLKLNRNQLEKNIDFAKEPIPHLFATVGWVPVNHVKDIERLAHEMGIHVEETAIEPSDVPPTYLENQSWGRVGEDLVGIFDTPSNTDKDPSYWVLLAFALFFAFIIGDGGYGAVYLGLLLFLRFKYPDMKGVKKRILNLGTLLAVFCIGWGLLTHAFFNISFDIDSPMRKLSLITWLAEKKADYVIATKMFNYTDWMKAVPDAVSGHDIIRKSSDILASLSDNILLELALFIGVVHILIGMIRYLPRNIPLFGWILFLVGAYLYFPYFLQVPSLLNYVFHVPYEMGAEVGLILIATGIPLAVILAIYKNGFTGIFELMNVIGIFADALSYLRLYALALAGSIVSATINSASSGLPIVLAVILICVAHIVNMALGIMGGVIHGLRLNFLEWYHYSFEGGGKKFKPLEIIKFD